MTKPILDIPKLESIIEEFVQPNGLAEALDGQYPINLTPDERQAIEIAFFSELTYQEAARRLNQPIGTVKSRIRSGLGKLRVVLGGTLEGK